MESCVIRTKVSAWKSQGTTPKIEPKGIKCIPSNNFLFFNRLKPVFELSKKYFFLYLSSWSELCIGVCVWRAQLTYENILSFCGTNLRFVKFFDGKLFAFNVTNISNANHAGRVPSNQSTLIAFQLQWMFDDFPLRFPPKVIWFGKR